MNDCEKYTELMSQMIDGELNAEQESELRTHIASCEECRRVFEAFEGVSSALADELVEPPEMLAKGVMFKLRNQKKHRRFLYGKFTAMAACLALVLFGAAKFGFFGGDLQNISLSNPAGSSAAYGAAQSVDGAGTSTGSTAKTGGKVSREQLKKGVKLKKTDDGTIYQLGFPIQNVQLLEGAKPEEVAKEPARLLDAKLVEIYDGTWYSDAELAEKNSAQTDTRTEIKNDRIATVMDAETLDKIDALLTAVPDATTELTIENRDFTNSDPVCTIYLPADQADETFGRDPAHDGIINQHHAFSLDHRTYGVQLDADRVLSHFLRRGNERASDVLVLDEPKRVRNSRGPRVADGRVQARVRHADHDVGIDRMLLR